MALVWVLIVAVAMLATGGGAAIGNFSWLLLAVASLATLLAGRS